PVRVDQSIQEPIREYEWSPDGRWLAYTKSRTTDYQSIYVYDTKGNVTHEMTGHDTDDFSPAWDPDGRYLYFLSHRDTNPILGTEDWDNIEAKNTIPYLILLRKDVENPFADLAGMPEKKGAEGAKDDEKKSGKDEKKGGKKDGKKSGDEEKSETPKPIDIDFDGLADRTVAFDVPPGVYSGMGATSTHVFYLSAPLKGFAEEGALFSEPEPDNTLMSYDLKKKDAADFMKGVTAYSLPLGGDKIAVMKKKGDIYVVDAGSAPSDLSDASVDMSDVVIDLDPLQEWSQIYWEAWRNERDFFWDPGMGGLDWKAIGARYATLLPRLASRNDLQDLLGQMIGELNNSHTYTWGGDPGVHVPQVSVGLLGADVTREGAAYRVDRIYNGAPADQDDPPLLAPGVGVHEGDYILAVNHKPFAAGTSFYSYFEDLAGRRVVLTVNGRNSMDGSRDVVVETVPDESELRYDDWVRQNREYVAKKSGGKLGYIHLPDMWSHGLIEFNRWFYPQLDKQGMVVDERWNGGGAVSPMIVERLARHLISFDRSRLGAVTPYPYKVLNGPFVVLMNEFAGSDGDIFPYVVQKEKLAPVIGTRTWGGVVGINGERHLVDGSMATEPEGAFWVPQEGWAIENHGVDPDIVVENLPQDVAKGVDAQLDRGIEETLKLLQAHPPVEPKFGPVRNRTRAAFEDELQPGK
ncbi:MAG: S41 family peptidase, partial [Hyphomicrobiales bacterium]